MATRTIAGAALRPRAALRYTAFVLKLYTFAISHFSEKTRWALDWSHIPFRDVRLLPGPHMLTTLRLAPRSSVPVLVDGGHTVQGSSAILDYAQHKFAASRLAPHPEQRAHAAELEALADHAFGFGVQCIAYDALLAHRDVVTELWAHGGPRWAHGFYALTYRIVARRIKQMYRIRADEVQRAKQRFIAAMDRFDLELSRAPYLGGRAPNRVDITVAALLAPLARPPEHLIAWPEHPPELHAFTRALENRPTTAHVLRMYREHRAPG